MLKYNACVKNIVVGLLLSFSALSISANANDINKLDIKKSNSNGSALNVTIYTENPYDENVAVTKKGDNKYVILMPNVSGNQTSSVDYSSIKDVVSDVSVKSVNDGAGGYTKVTLTTTKPVSITTTSKKSVPLTAEQKAYKTLIAQSKGYTTQNNQSLQPRPKADVENYSTSAAQKSASPMIFTANSSSKTASNDSNAKPKSVIDKIKGIVDSSANQSNAADIGLDNSKVVTLPTLDTSYKTDSGKGNKAAQNNKKANTVSAAAKVNNVAAKTDVAPKQEITKTENTEPETAPVDAEAVQTKVTDNIQTQPINKGLDNTMLTTLIILLTSLLGITALFRVVKNSLEHSVALKRAFKENLKAQPKSDTVDYSAIAEDSSLSWQEKYQKFVNSLEEINPNEGVLEHVGNGEYQFVNSIDEKTAELHNIFKIGKSEKVTGISAGKSNLKPKAKPKKLTSYNKPAMNAMPKSKPIRKVKNQNLKASGLPRLEIVERKSEANTKLDYKKLASKFERTLKASPSKERLTQADEDLIIKQFENGFKDTHNVPVATEEEAIAKTIRTSPKLKSFAQKAALEKNGRHVTLPKRSSEIIRTGNIESKYVNLENSDMYSSVRRFKDGNLSSADLISGNAMGSRINLPKTTPVKNEDNTQYSMATIEEFFDMPETSYATAPASLSSRVADSMGRMGKAKLPEYNKEAVSNPLEGKIVKSGYNIDNNSGFYIVSDGNGRCSLIGKINNEVTVLKEFGNSVRYKLQVRKDSPNVYIVRVGAERFLVEVNGNKMGVLIEL